MGNHCSGSSPKQTKDGDGSGEKANRTSCYEISKTRTIGTETTMSTLEKSVQCQLSDPVDKKNINLTLGSKCSCLPNIPVCQQSPFACPVRPYQGDVLCRCIQNFENEIPKGIAFSNPRVSHGSQILVIGPQFNHPQSNTVSQNEQTRRDIIEFFNVCHPTACDRQREFSKSNMHSTLKPPQESQNVDQSINLLHGSQTVKSTDPIRTNSTQNYNSPLSYQPEALFKNRWIGKPTTNCRHQECKQLFLRSLLNNINGDANRLFVHDRAKSAPDLLSHNQLPTIAYLENDKQSHESLKPECKERLSRSNSCSAISEGHGSAVSPGKNSYNPAKRFAYSPSLIRQTTPSSPMVEQTNQTCSPLMLAATSPYHATELPVVGSNHDIQMNHPKTSQPRPGSISTQEEYSCLRDMPCSPMLEISPFVCNTQTFRDIWPRQCQAERILATTKNLSSLPLGAECGECNKQSGMPGPYVLSTNHHLIEATSPTHANSCVSEEISCSHALPGHCAMQHKTKPVDAFQKLSGFCKLQPISNDSSSPCQKPRPSPRVSPRTKTVLIKESNNPGKRSRSGSQTDIRKQGKVDCNVSNTSIFYSSQPRDPFKYRFFLKDFHGIDKVLADPTDRRIRAICDRFRCDLEIYSKVPKNGYMQYIIDISSPSIWALHSCTRALDSSLKWCLSPQLFRINTNGTITK
ncbi:hypothetical protein CRM22_009337 [Opisthorchis felineus]|uniref:Uncharacterized protein n=1 Tax=Opisthorchis felineus TaxID=147828 RepID=A0A4S2L805_OPIFE|nr:hypothetical protein CRM22_009337 [Opisthorchis felineus]